MLFELSQNQRTLLIRLVEELSAQLLQGGRKIVTVESCTGGSVAALFTHFAGSSAWFERGFVTYSNQSKIEMVGVQSASLQSDGAVSEKVAGEMAAGGVRNSLADCALSITGIAGPQGVSETKPVGTVCFAWAGFGTGQVITEQCHFEGDRSAVRLQSVQHALQGAISLLKR